MLGKLHILLKPGRSTVGDMFNSCPVAILKHSMAQSHASKTLTAHFPDLNKGQLLRRVHSALRIILAIQICFKSAF
jgi:hypothetical protein